MELSFNVLTTRKIHRNSWLCGLDSFSSEWLSQLKLLADIIYRWAQICGSTVNTVNTAFDTCIYFGWVYCFDIMLITNLSEILQHGVHNKMVRLQFFFFFSFLYRLEKRRKNQRKILNSGAMNRMLLIGIKSNWCLSFIVVIMHTVSVIHSVWS